MTVQCVKNYLDILLIINHKTINHKMNHGNFLEKAENVNNLHSIFCSLIINHNRSIDHIKSLVSPSVTLSYSSEDGVVCGVRSRTVRKERRTLMNKTEVTEENQAESDMEKSTELIKLK